MELIEFQAIVFDLDGTLIDSEKYHAQAFADAVEVQSGYTLNEQEKKEFFGSHSTRFSAVLNERYGLQLVPEEVLAFKRARVLEIFKADLFDGARAFLEKWYGVKPLALATNSPLDFVAPALEEVDLFKYFDCVTTASEVTHRKPHPEIVQITLDKLGTKPQKTLVLEDQMIGVEAAQQAGTAVWVVDNGQRVTFPPDIPRYGWKELMEL